MTGSGSLMMALMHTMVGGAIILVVPAFLICAGITWAAYRRRGSAARD